MYALELNIVYFELHVRIDQKWLLLNIYDCITNLSVWLLSGRYRN